MQAITKARVLGWGQLAVVYANELLSKNGGVIPQNKAQWLALVSSALVALGMHIGSSTSAGHPDGSKKSEKGFGRISAVFAVALLSICLTSFMGCRHVNSNNPAVVKAVTLLDAENTVNAIAHGLQEANQTLKNLKATEPEYYQAIHPKLVQIAQLNEKANQAILAARNGNANADWKGALVAIGSVVTDPASLTTFGFKNVKTQQIVQVSFAALVSGISLAASYGGK